MTASIRAGRAYLFMTLVQSNIERADGDNLFSVSGAERKGRRLIVRIPEHPDRVRERLNGKEVRVTSRDKRKVNDFRRLETGATSTLDASVISIKDIQRPDKYYYESTEADVTLDLNQKGKVYMGDSERHIPTSITIEALQENNPKRLNQELDLVLEFENGEGLTEPGRVFKTGEFPKPSSDNLRKKEGLDEAQNRAYGFAMEFDRCPVLFIHGGPGTGKTSTICNVVEGHISEGRKVLVLSHSNKGAQVPALMLKKKGLKVHIAGNAPEKVTAELRRDRIKWRANFPVARIQAITRMSDTEIIRDHLPKDAAYVLLSDPEKGEMKLIRAVRQWKNARIGEILAKYQEKLAEREKKFRESIEEGGVAFSTLGTLLNDKILQDTDFDVVIVDEATRLRTPDLVIALKKAGKQIIFVGDPLQLGNIPIEPDQKKNLKSAMTEGAPWTSYFGTTEPEAVLRTRENLEPCLYKDPSHAEQAVSIFEQGPFATPILKSKHPETDLPYVFLDQDRRSLPAIVKVLSELIYGGKLKPGREPNEGEGNGVVEWLNTSDLNPEEHTSGTSRRNPVEVQIITQKVLQAIFRDKVPPEDIAVIAAYRAQAEAIKSRLGKFRTLRENKELFDRIAANISTVDAFQGDERRKVFVSLTRSNKAGNIGFLEEQRRIGVAVGRAKEALYVVGDVNTVVEKNNNPSSQAFFRKMKELIEGNGKVTTLDQVKGHRRRKRGWGSGEVRKKRRKNL